MDLMEACARARKISRKIERPIRVVYGRGGKYTTICHDEVCGFEVWATYKNGRCVRYTPWGRR